MRGGSALAVPSVTSRRSAGQVLADTRARVEPALRAAVDTLPEGVRGIAGYHFGWWDAAGRPVREGGGKAIRPALALLAAEVVGADAVAAVPAAAAVQLVHEYSLLHDDVLDGDVTRRHLPTAWRVYGRTEAVLAGDALLGCALDVLARSGHPAVRQATRMLTGAVLRLVAGQVADVGFETRTDVGLAECLRMAAAKTAALLGAACGMGTLYGGGDPQQVARLTDFGSLLGLAFQHVDDLLGIWGDPSVTGKPVHSDLRSRKKSLPVVAALASDTAPGRELSTLYHRQSPLTDPELVRAAELVELAGGRAWSRHQADLLLAQAGRHLAAAAVSTRAAMELHDLARLVTRRDH